MKGFTRIIIWLGLMAVLTLIAMGIWYICTGGSQTTASLKWLQFMQTIGTFLLPALLGAWLWDERRRPFRWLRMEQGVEGQQFVLAVLLMVCAIPAINLLADLNSRIQLPESLDFIEQIFKQQEEAAALLTERFLKADTVSGLLVNIGLMALLPAIAEEVSFRGTLLQIIRGEQSAKSDYRVHWAIWITAFIFSAIHMQFYGFIPRILMGAMFGYIFVWTGSLWVPILMHFTNNGIAVLVYYLMGESMDGKSYADTFGAGTTWWVGVLSLLITSLGLLIFYRRTHTR